MGVLGADEWAWSKRQRFGTLLVNLERRRVLDVLAESTSDALAAWLTAHPGGDDHQRRPPLQLCGEGSLRSPQRHSSCRPISHGAKSATSGGKRACRSSEGAAGTFSRPAAHRKARGREEDPPDPGSIPGCRALPANGRAASPGKDRATSNHSSNESGGDESYGNRRATGYHRRRIGRAEVTLGRNAFLSPRRSQQPTAPRRGVRFPSEA